MVCERFEPEAIVCQCGADGLAYDEMDSFNLSSDAYVHCVESVLALNLPTLLLGGGEYPLQGFLVLKLIFWAQLMY